MRRFFLRCGGLCAAFFFTTVSAQTPGAAKNAVVATSGGGNAVDKLGGIQLSISLGTAKCDSHSVVRNSEAVASSVSAGGRVANTDIKNHAHYQAESVSVNLGTGFSAKGKLAPTGAGVGFGKDSDSAASTTHAGISGVAGDTAVRTGDKEAGIAKIFDADKVQKEVAAQTQITQMFSTLAPKAVATFADG